LNETHLLDANQSASAFDRTQDGNEWQVGDSEQDRNQPWDYRGAMNAAE
jgi:hypothetical protein